MAESAVDYGLVAFGPNLWVADGPEVVSFGFRYPTRMAVIRLEDGSLFVWSPVALSDVLKSDVEALGPVRHIVSPSKLHNLWLADWQAAYPDAALYAPPGLRRRRPDLSFDHDLTDDPPPAWAGQVDQVILRGHLLAEEVVFHHRASRTVIFCDLLQQFPPGWFSGWQSLIAWMDGMVGETPSVPQKFRLAFTRRGAARAALSKILSWQPEQLIIAHGALVSGNATKVVQEAFSWLGDGGAGREGNPSAG